MYLYVSKCTYIMFYGNYICDAPKAANLILKCYSHLIVLK